LRESGKARIIASVWGSSRSTKQPGRNAHETMKKKPGTRRAREPVDLGMALMVAWKTSTRVTEYLLDHLDATLWRAEPPGDKGRTIASIFAHLHNVRLMLLVQARARGVPPKLDRHRATAVQARAALSESADPIAAVLESAAGSGGRVRNSPPDAVAFFSAAVTREAHHRGQIAMLARQLGHPLSPEAMLGMWESAKRRKEALGGKAAPARRISRRP